MGSVICHDGIPPLVGLGETHDEVNHTAQGSKDNPIEPAAGSAWQDECGKCREKGQDDYQELPHRNTSMCMNDWNESMGRL